MRWTLIQPFSGDSSAAITRDVLWPADPAQCCLRGNGRVQLFVVADLAAAEVGLDRAGATVFTAIPPAPNSLAR